MPTLEIFFKHNIHKRGLFLGGVDDDDIRAPLYTHIFEGGFPLSSEDGHPHLRTQPNPTSNRLTF